MPHPVHATVVTSTVTGKPSSPSEYCEIPADGDWYVAQLIRSLSHITDRGASTDVYRFAPRCEAEPPLASDPEWRLNSQRFEWSVEDDED